MKKTGALLRSSLCVFGTISAGQLLSSCPNRTKSGSSSAGSSFRRGIQSLRRTRLWPGRRPNTGRTGVRNRPDAKNRHDGRDALRRSSGQTRISSVLFSRFDYTSLGPGLASPSSVFPLFAGQGASPLLSANRRGRAFAGIASAAFERRVNFGRGCMQGRAWRVPFF